VEAQGVKLTLAHAKTDKIDSDVLALLLRADVIPEAHRISPEMRGPRDQMRARLHLVEKFNVPSVDELGELYRLQAARHEAHIDLLQRQIRTIETERTRHRSGSKQGNRYLKLAFSHAAVRAVQYYPEVRAFYRAKKRKKPDFNGLFKGKPLRRTKQSRWPRLPSPSG
jgi:hypothetical protein